MFADTPSAEIYSLSLHDALPIYASTGKVVGDIKGLPRTHGALVVNATNRGFTTNAGDSTPTMFDLASLAVVRHVRSEEHTSELQSHVNLVCRLLLEKKNHIDAPE